MDGEFSKLAFNHWPEHTTSPGPPQSLPLPDDARDNAMPLEPLVMLRPVVALACDRLGGGTSDQMRYPPPRQPHDRK
jgi:hypothetical protein